MRRAIARAIVALCLCAALPVHASEQSKILYSRGLVEFHADRFSKALELFDQAVATDPSDVYARYYRAVTRGRLNDLDGAISDLREVLAAQPDLNQAALDLGVSLIQKGQYSEAIPWLEQAQRVDDLEGQASLFLGLAQLRLGRLGEARANFRRAAEHDPTQSLPARYYQGVADYQEGNWAQAEGHFRYVSQASPGTDMGREADAFLEKLRRGDRARYEAYGSVGYQYDSNVGLLNDVTKALVPNQPQGDSRLTIGLGGAYAPWRNDWAQFTVGYDFFQSFHDTLNEFDLQDHGPSAQILATLGPVQLGLLGRYDYYLLDNQSFLQEGTALPWVTVFSGNAGRLEVMYRMRRRDFKIQSFAVRNAFNHAVGAKQFFYLGSADRYLSVGYQFDHEDPVMGNTEAQSFAYDGNEVNLGVGAWLPYQLHAEATYAYRHEHYGQDSAEVETLLSGSRSRRNDNENEVVVAVRKAIFEHLDITAAYFGDFNNSNNSDFQYRRHVGSVALEVRY